MKIISSRISDRSNAQASSERWLQSHIQNNRNRVWPAFSMGVLQNILKFDMSSSVINHLPIQSHPERTHVRFSNTGSFWALRSARWQTTRSIRLKEMLEVMPWHCRPSRVEKCTSGNLRRSLCWLVCLSVYWSQRKTVITLHYQMLGKLDNPLLGFDSSWGKVSSCCRRPEVSSPHLPIHISHSVWNIGCPTSCQHLDIHWI
jgi:hypothetical protein